MSVWGERGGGSEIPNAGWGVVDRMVGVRERGRSEEKGAGEGKEDGERAEVDRRTSRRRTRNPYPTPTLPTLTPASP